MWVAALLCRALLVHLRCESPAAETARQSEWNRYNGCGVRGEAVKRERRPAGRIYYPDGSPAASSARVEDA